MRTVVVSSFLVLLFHCNYNAFADSDFYWPQPDPPYEETDPFIEPVKSGLHDQESVLDKEPALQPGGLEDVPLQEPPLESDPLLRTPLEEMEEQEGMIPDPLQEDEPLPDHPLEGLESPLSKVIGEKKTLLPVLMSAAY
ncbi:MAG: hypothetical protein AAGG81_01830 [Chlamydiota bacterium]